MSSVSVVTRTGGKVTLDPEVLGAFRAGLRGRLVTKEDAGYDETRALWNAMIDSRPALIARCAGAADVIHCLKLAREKNLRFSVRGAGHNIAGKATCDGGLMIDLSGMRDVRVDPTTRTVRTGPGATLGDVDHETQAFGLAVPVGINSTTGIAGLTLGGGFGWITRKHGLTVDNLLSADVVLADGRLVHASPKTEPDLFWGLRGGGGNLGIVTSFEFQLHEMNRTVIGGIVGFPMSEAKQILEFYADYSLEAPDELGLEMVMFGSSPENSMITLAVCYCGRHADMEPILKKIRSAGTVVVDTVGAMDYVALQKSGDVNDVRAIGSYTKSGFSEYLTPDFIDTIVRSFEAREGRNTVFATQHAGGSINRIAADATAFPHRDINYIPLLIIDWPIDSDPAEHIAWLKQTWKSIEPHIQGFYTNDLIDESQKQVDENYLGNYKRLVEIKNRWDPTNLFRLNANVIPTA